MTSRTYQAAAILPLGMTACLFAAPPAITVLQAS